MLPVRAHQARVGGVRRLLAKTARVLLFTALFFAAAMAVEYFGGIGKAGKMVAPERSLLESDWFQEEGESSDEDVEHDEWFDEYGPLVKYLVIMPVTMMLTVFMMCGLAVVCDEFFEAANDRAAFLLGLPRNIKVATFTAIASSAPELFTAMVGTINVLLGGSSEDNPSVGTIVGSAVFNVAIIIGMSTWINENDRAYLPVKNLCRDVAFYLVSIGGLVVSLFVWGDPGEVGWYESLGLMGLYVLYIVTVGLLECFFPDDKPEGEATAGGELAGQPVHELEAKPDLLLDDYSLLRSTPVYAHQISSSPVMLIPPTGQSIPVQIGELSPLLDGQNTMSTIDAHELELRAGAEGAAVGYYWCCDCMSCFCMMPWTYLFSCCIPHVDMGCSCCQNDEGKGCRKCWTQKTFTATTESGNLYDFPDEPQTFGAGADRLEYSDEAEDDSDEDAAKECSDILKASWDSFKSCLEVFTCKPLAPAPMISFVSGADITVRGPTEMFVKAAARDLDSSDNAIEWKEYMDTDFYKKRYPESGDAPHDATSEGFFGRCVLCCTSWHTLAWFLCVLVICILSYAIVFCVEIIGHILGISATIMGLSLLAAGTSLPDLMTSMKEVKNGGEEGASNAISNALGSNIFDICIGLGLPWMIYSLALGEPMKIDMTGIIWYIGMQVGVLLLFLVAYAPAMTCKKIEERGPNTRWGNSCGCEYWFKWSKQLGLGMMVLYVLFMTAVIVLEVLGVTASD
eukprot:747964_1